MGNSFIETLNGRFRPECPNENWVPFLAGCQGEGGIMAKLLQQRKTPQCLVKPVTSGVPCRRK